jgi:hypothetical protein
MPPVHARNDIYLGNGRLSIQEGFGGVNADKAASNLALMATVI